MSEEPCNTAKALLPEAPASVAKVICLLNEKDKLTNKEIQEATGLPRRTLYSALQRLQQEGLVRQQISLTDTRQTYFWLSGRPAIAS
jgi:DNA-binding MarR family transcriptional regulator